LGVQNVEGKNQKKNFYSGPPRGLGELKKVLCGA
jgi:hypothetical protein